MKHLGRCIVYWLTATSTAWHRRLAAYLIVVAGFAMCLQLIAANGAADRKRDSDRAQSSLYQDCEARRDGREVLRAVVLLVNPSGGTDYSQLESFADLDPATQRFLIEVSAPRPDGEGFREQALKKIPPIICTPPS